MNSRQTRLKKISDMLQSRSDMEVSELSKVLNISEVTIRKDLSYLEAKGAIIRYHGGARLSEFAVKDINAPFKMAIAEAAASLINDDDTICISSGSTCQRICQTFGRKQNLYVLTNSVTILNESVTYPGVTTFFLGGKVDREMLITTGTDLDEQLNKYTADKLFLGMDGIDPTYGATTYNHVEKDVMQRLISHAKCKILVADGTKLGKVTFAKIADLTEFDVLITNETSTNKDIIAKIETLGLQVIRA